MIVSFILMTSMFALRAMLIGGNIYLSLAGIKGLMDSCAKTPDLA